MPGRCRAWHLEALALLHQVRSRNSDIEQICLSNQECNVESTCSVTQVCHGMSALSGRRGKRTIAERARESVFSRLMDILSQIIAVQEDLYSCVSHNSVLKDSIELKNLGLRMAEDNSSPSDRDLRDLQRCLKSIAEKLSSLCKENKTSDGFVILKIQQIYETFPEMW